MLHHARACPCAVQGNCPSPPPADMADGTLPANLSPSNGWPYAKLPPLQLNQCVLRTASGFVDISGDSEFWLDNIVLQAPYLFYRDEAVAPTAADRPPKALPRGNDYLEFEPAAPDADYEASAPYTRSYAGYYAYSPYDDSYAPSPAGALYDDSYAPIPAASYHDYPASAPGPYDGYEFPPLGSRGYEGRAAYPDYEEAPSPADPFPFSISDLARNTALNGPLIQAYGAATFAFVPAPATTPPSRRIWLTGVTMSGARAHMRTDSTSLLASGALCDI